MSRYLPKTVREYGRIYLAQCLAERGWQYFIARRSPNEDEVIAGIPERNQEVLLKFHSQQTGQAIRFYDPDGLDWEWQCLVIATRILDDAPITYLLSRDDVRSHGRLEEELDGALWLQPHAFAVSDFKEAWHKIHA